MKNQKISIITICYNSEKYIEQTIQSAINQSLNTKEFIIIDGGSTDGTLGIIKKHEKNINHWISEPDGGISDAMNKGLNAATGDYILFLHSDDYLINDEVLEIVSRHLDSKHDIFLFDIFLLNNGNRKLTKPRGFNWWMNFKTGVWHQSAICSSRLFKRIGDFDTNFKIAMDYDFFLRAYRDKVKVRKIGTPLSVMRNTGVSSQLDWPSLKKRFEEQRQIHFKNCESKIMQITYDIFSFFYMLYRRILSFAHNKN
jgi:glycosyltransferase involved in cell wall biosynthesis